MNKITEVMMSSLIYLGSFLLSVYSGVIVYDFFRLAQKGYETPIIYVYSSTLLLVAFLIVSVLILLSCHGAIKYRKFQFALVSLFGVFWASLYLFGGVSLI